MTTVWRAHNGGPLTIKGGQMKTIGGRLWYTVTIPDSEAKRERVASKRSLEKRSRRANRNR